MIAFVDNIPAESEAAAVRALFAPDGALGAAVTGDFIFEDRPQQKVMAAAVARAVNMPAHLAVEAGTGVGKTMAYLAPLMRLVAAGRRPLAVSTHTINLQEQIAGRDIPLLCRRLGLELKAVVCKGRANYLCMRRLMLAHQMESDLFRPDQAAWLDLLARAAGEMYLAQADNNPADACDGSISAFSDGRTEPPPPAVWEQVCAEFDNCLGRRCAYYRRCFLMRARAAAFDADILILNHHLLFSNLAVGMLPDTDIDGGFLPEFDVLVLDEAHCVEQTASDHFGLRLTQGGLEMWLRRLYVPDTGRGLMAVLHDHAGLQTLKHAWEDAGLLFRRINEWAAFSARDCRRLVAQPLDMAGLLPERLGAIVALLRRHADAVDDQDLRMELASLARRGTAMRDTLQSFMGRALDNQVYWVEAAGVRRRIALCSAPIEVGAILSGALFDRFASVILTSATLSVKGNLEYFRGRIGAAGIDELVLASPFDFVRQMRLYLMADMPEPSEAGFAAGLEQAIKYFLSMTAGRAFVLFTNGELMRNLAARLQPFIDENDMSLMVQGRGLSRHAMLDRFRNGARAVLFGLDSFWMGVDVRGEALGNVIITRLPFSVPDEPVARARMDLIKARGGNAFYDYALPEAVLKFRQGVGRLIRSATDTGIVAVMDARILRRNYGRIFMQSIPECPVDIVSMSDISLNG